MTTSTTTITAIFTRSDNTQLTIQIQEEVLHLVSMGTEFPPITLSFGVNQIVIPAGVFKLTSRCPVQVTAAGQDVTVSSLQGTNKDSGWPDPLTLSDGVSQTAVRDFFADARSDEAP